MYLNNGSSSEIRSYPHLAFVMDKALVSRFFLLLQQGVVIRCRIGCSIAAFLREEIGASTQTIEKIQSIILDGKPVDDIETACIKDNATLALSAAMPGLVGATLRRGGTYSSFRGAITYHETGGEYAPREGLIKVKIFNLLMSELGPGLLQKGVIISSEDFIRVVAGQSQEFWQGCRQISLDGEPLAAEELPDAEWLSGRGQVLLSVSSDQARA